DVEAPDVIAPNDEDVGLRTCRRLCRRGLRKRSTNHAERSDGADRQEAAPPTSQRRFTLQSVSESSILVHGFILSTLLVCSAQARSSRHAARERWENKGGELAVVWR